MSPLLRLSNLIRSIKPISSLRPTQRPPASTFFSPSRTPHPSGPLQTRLYAKNNRSNVSKHTKHTKRTDYAAQEKANKTVLYTLMGTSIAVFSCAKYKQTQAAQGYQAPFIRFLQMMSLNYTEFRNGNYLPLFTSMFTHLEIVHLFTNMFTTYYLGSMLATAPMITPGRFLFIALGAGFVGNVGTLCSRYYQTRESGRPDYQRSLGFSGSLMGISSVTACLAPTAKVQLWGIVPMPLWALVGAYAVYDGYYLNSENSRIGHAGHLGGLGFGIIYYFVKLRGGRY